MEEWRDIIGYEGLYQVSNLGRIKSIYRNHIMKARLDKYGYYQIGLTKNKKQRFFKVHRLVAQAFIDNPQNYPQINHKDEVKTNNNVNNLEWCTNLYNMNYGTRRERASEKCKKKVMCITTGEIFSSINEASKKYNINNKGAISFCCKGKQHTAGKHPITKEPLKWKYI